ncbi:MAG: hypothetical protein BWZ10_03138 [candidate division BRC1 bacterium ADurb.BinA364]|nr:MAG: hypothetical protein BWZ10_03138 [candidate division BRC1 bacterium ADurb.BinA364]
MPLMEPSGLRSSCASPMENAPRAASWSVRASLRRIASPRLISRKVKTHPCGEPSDERSIENDTLKLRIEAASLSEKVFEWKDDPVSNA